MTDSSPGDAPAASPQVTWDRDGEHLTLLAVFHYVKGALWTLGCLGGLVYLGMAVLFGAVLQDMPASDHPPPEQVAHLVTGLFGVIGFGLGLVSLTMAALCVLAARGLQTGRRRTLIYVVAALDLLSFPFGTALGICTIIVMSRPSVAVRFEGRDRLDDRRDYRVA